MKKIVFSCLMVIVPAVLLACMIVGAGCEAANGVDSLTISPSSTTLTYGTNTVSSNGMSVVFTVSSGSTNTSLTTLSFPLVWSVSDSSLGSIVGSSGNSAVYLGNERSGNNIVTARDQFGNEGYATVTQSGN